jgi:hypothetical protein
LIFFWHTVSNLTWAATPAFGLFYTFMFTRNHWLVTKSPKTQNSPRPLARDPKYIHPPSAPILLHLKVSIEMLFSPLCVWPHSHFNWTSETFFSAPRLARIRRRKKKERVHQPNATPCGRSNLNWPPRQQLQYWKTNVGIGLFVGVNSRILHVLRSFEDFLSILKKIHKFLVFQQGKVIVAPPKKVGGTQKKGKPPQKKLCSLAEVYLNSQMMRLLWIEHSASRFHDLKWTSVWRSPN